MRMNIQMDAKHGGPTFPTGIDLLKAYVREIVVEIERRQRQIDEQKSWLWVKLLRTTGVKICISNGFGASICHQDI
ncbi:hypothetical protein PV327_004456 [Microctonus hyperodae]|uniref:Uncharacterized protein n=1 Tax=Microctonus hyperodae TaxID=165561 RepID=A0AA39FCL0_MICHY|nr:hypothetical protein PV327_004456 [Microctonus hyperodae]